MMARQIVAIALLAGGILLGADKGVSDERIVDQVRMKLATDADVKGGALDVTVKDGVVTLKGRVDSERGRTKATRLTRKIKGVKQVENNLVVGPPTI